MVIIQLDSEQLFEVIESAVRKVISEQPSAIAPSNGKTIFNLHQFCEYIGLSKQTAYKLTSKGLVPFSKRGKRLYFEKAVIDSWLLQHRAGSTSQIEQKADEYLIVNRGRRVSK